MQMRIARNIAILLALAAALDLLPGASRAGNVLGAALQVAFFAGLGFLAYRMYRQHRVALFSLGDRMRGLLYASAVVALLGIAATARLWQTGAGTIVWFALVLGAIYGFVVVARAAREG
jgi:tellurite resistance protein TehA-like permease